MCWDITHLWSKLNLQQHCWELQLLVQWSGYNVTDQNLSINSSNTCKGMMHCFLGDFYNLSFSSDFKNVDIVYSHFLLSL